ncbi:MAG: hypothetical protein ABF271_15350, partial [Abyssibacter sp.]|uniref:hypothetical protein n=1 Tax=Abyssibacter sp. TaxID=2320200 RepID=UPI0032197A15
SDFTILGCGAESPGKIGSFQTFSNRPWKRGRTPLNLTSVTGTPATTYIGFDTTMAYDEIQFRFTTGGEYLIYEFCHSANVN